VDDLKENNRALFDITVFFSGIPLFRSAQGKRTCGGFNKHREKKIKQHQRRRGEKGREMAAKGGLVRQAGLARHQKKIRSTQKTKGTRWGTPIFRETQKRKNIYHGDRAPTAKGGIFCKQDAIVGPSANEKFLRHELKKHTVGGRCLRAKAPGKRGRGRKWRVAGINGKGGITAQYKQDPSLSTGVTASETTKGPGGKDRYCLREGIWGVGWNRPAGVNILLA